MDVSGSTTYYAFVNTHDGLITGHGKAEAYENLPAGATVISADHHATISAELAEHRQCRLVNGVLRHTPLPSPSLPALETLKQSALATVDAQAEAARRVFLTDGAGQRAEYEATAHEAAIVQLIPRPEAYGGQEALDPDDYPHLQAEVAALAAVGIETTVRAVADAVGQVRAQGTVRGAWIKQVRRTAKLRIAAAPDAETVAAVLSGIDWQPSPVLEPDADVAHDER